MSSRPPTSTPCIQLSKWISTASRPNWPGCNLARDALARQTKAYRSQLSVLADATASFDDLTRTQKKAEDNYLLYAKKTEEARIAGESLDREKIANVAIAETPVEPHLPSKPNVPLNFALGGLLAAFLSLGVAFAAEYFRDTVEQPSDWKSLPACPSWPLPTVTDLDLMYHNHFGLREEPFGVTPDRRFFYQSAQHREAAGHAFYAIEQRRGFALLLGGAGLGKTSVLFTLSQMLKGGSKSPTSQTLTTIARRCWTPSWHPWAWSRRIPGASHKVFYQYLLEIHKSGKTVGCHLREAQDLNRDTLEAIRMLSNFETPGGKLVQIVWPGSLALRRRWTDRIANRFGSVSTQSPAWNLGRPRDSASTCATVSNRRGIDRPVQRPTRTIGSPPHRAASRAISIRSAINSLSLAYALEKPQVGTDEVGRSLRDLDLPTVECWPRVTPRPESAVSARSRGCLDALPPPSPGPDGQLRPAWIAADASPCSPHARSSWADSGLEAPHEQECLIFEKAASTKRLLRRYRTGPPTPANTWTSIRHLFQRPLASCGSGKRSRIRRSSEACQGNRGRTGRWGQPGSHRAGGGATANEPVPDFTACLPGRSPKVSLWPHGGAPVEFFRSAAPAPQAAIGSIRCAETSIRWYSIAPRSKRRPPPPRSRPRRMRRSWWWKLAVHQTTDPA